MNIIQKFLNETTYWIKGDGSRFKGAGKKNAPTFAWETVNGKEYKGTKSGRAPNTVEREWNGIMVDEFLEDQWLDDLNSIKEIEVRASCQGHSPEGEWPSFIIFRPISKINLDKFVEKISADKYTFCKYESGNQGFPRVCIATPLYAKCSKHVLWEKWWQTLASRIKKCLK